MRPDQRFVHILRQQHPAFFLGMVQSDRAELFGELHAERLFRKPPRRVAASAHLDRLAVFVRIPPSASGRSGRFVEKFDPGVHVILLADDLGGGLHVEHRQFGVDLRAVQRHGVDFLISVFGHHLQLHVFGQRNLRLAGNDRRTVDEHFLAVVGERRNHHLRIGALDPFQIHGLERARVFVEREREVARQRGILRFRDAEGQQFAGGIKPFELRDDDLLRFACRNAHRNRRRALRAGVGGDGQREVVFGDRGVVGNLAPFFARRDLNARLVGRDRRREFFARTADFGKLGHGDREERFRRTCGLRHGDCHRFALRSAHRDGRRAFLLVGIGHDGQPEVVFFGVGKQFRLAPFVGRADRYGPAGSNRRVKRYVVDTDVAEHGLGNGEVGSLRQILDLLVVVGAGSAHQACKQRADRYEKTGDKFHFKCWFEL